ADVTIIRVLENASLPLQPESRPVIMPLLSCYLLVFVAGALLILFRQWRQDRISAPDEADALLGYKLLGELPQVPGQQQTAELAGVPAYAEAMRNIRTRLSIRMNAEEEPAWSELSRARVITVTSACQGEGKTAVATQLALSLGQFSRV